MTAYVEADVDAWFDSLEMKESTILKIFPGKELMKTLRRILVEQSGVDLLDADLLRVITKPRVAEDLKATLKLIADGRNK